MHRRLCTGRLQQRRRPDRLDAGARAGGAGYNGALGDGVDVVLGGGTQFFVPKDGGRKRADGRNPVNELKAKGHAFAQNRDDLPAADATQSGKLTPAPAARRGALPWQTLAGYSRKEYADYPD